MHRIHEITLKRRFDHVGLINGNDVSSSWQKTMADDTDVKLKMYEELCTSYRAIDDFRSKLLGFLPLVSGSGVFLLLNDSLTDDAKRKVTLLSLALIGWFGFVVTIGLFFYEIYGIRKCHALIEAGRRLECSLGVQDGQFRRRPRSVLYLINEPLAAGVIYPAVLAAWLLLALIPPSETLKPAARVPQASIIIFVIGFVLMLVFNLVIDSGKPKFLYDLLLGKRAEHPSECK